MFFRVVLNVLATLALFALTIRREVWFKLEKFTLFFMSAEFEIDGRKILRRN